MKIRTYQIILCLTTFFLFSQQAETADFSQVQQIIVPPSYIQRGLNALGANNWNIPGLNANTTPVNPNLDPGVGTQINRSSSVANLSVTTIQKRVAFLMNAGQLDDAESLARAGLKAYPNNAILKGQFANITASEAQQFLQEQNYDMAGRKARESLVANPGNRISKAVDNAVLSSQALDPNLAEGHVSAGDTLTADGRLLEATVEYKLALQIKPNAPAHVGLGNIAIGKGQIAEASHHFERALSLDANSSLAYRQRGALRYLSKDMVGASADFSKAVSLNPNDQLASEALVGLWKQQVSAFPNSVNGHLGLARAYMQTQNLEAARNEYKAVVAIDPNSPTLPAARASFKLALAKQEANQSVQAAKTLDGQGAWNEAHQKLIEAITYCPNDPQILLYNGQICERLGLTTEAHDSYMAVLKSDPKNILAASRLKALGYNNPVGAVAQPGILQMSGMQSPINGPVVPNFLPSNSLPPVNALPNTPASIPTGTPSFNGNPFNNNPAPLPDTNFQNIPFKPPLVPKTQSNLPFPFGNAYYDAGQNLYLGDSAQVTMLGNFGSYVRALIMAEKQFLQTPGNSGNLDRSTNSGNLSSIQPSYF